MNTRSPACLKFFVDFVCHFGSSWVLLGATCAPGVHHREAASKKSSEGHKIPMLFARLTLLSSLFLLAASDGNHSQLRGAIAEPFCPTRKTWETCLGGADQCCSTCRCASTDHCYKKDEYFAQCQPKLHCPTNYPGWSCAIVPPCEDLHVQCGIWAKEGRCNSKSPDADYMISTCQRACQRCM